MVKVIPVVAKYNFESFVLINQTIVGHMWMCKHIDDIVQNIELKLCCNTVPLAE